MSTCAGKKAEITPTEASAPNEAKVNLERRRALVKAGWAVPAILAIGLPSRESKALGPTGSPVGMPASGADPVAEFRGGIVDPVNANASGGGIVDPVNADNASGGGIVDPVNTDHAGASATAISTSVNENVVIIEIFNP
jgi:hypothetical protein